jgi:hypothetical protein
LLRAFRAGHVPGALSDARYSNIKTMQDILSERRLRAA